MVPYIFRTASGLTVDNSVFVCRAAALVTHRAAHNCNSVAGAGVRDGGGGECVCVHASSPSETHNTTLAPRRTTVRVRVRVRFLGLGC